jgi:diguanylate cyclase (GGDEF)-like protein/PAS domain S-box-containing protein
MAEQSHAEPVTGYVDDGSIDLLGVVFRAVASLGTDSVTILRPVRTDDGEVVDFRVIADTGMTAGLAQTASLGRTLRELMPARFAQRLVELNRGVLASGVTIREDFVLGVDDRGDPAVPPDGPDAGPVREGEVLRIPALDHVVVLWRDVTDSRAVQREVVAAKTRFERLLEHASDTVIVTTAERVITYASPSLGAVLNVDPQTLLGTRFGNFFSDRQDVSVGEDLFAQVLAQPRGGTARAEAEVRRGDGAVRRVAYVATNWLDDPVVGGVVINALDVTEQHEARRLLEEQALTDSLTGLPNRRWFGRALELAIRRSRQTGSPFALLLLDVDNFKVLNDSLGHSAGDRLLVEMSHRTASVLGPRESIARLGGDEFVILAESVSRPDDATAVARRIAEAAATRYDLGHLATHVTVSIGVVTHDGAHADAADEPVDVQADALLAHADAALYEAKHRGRDRVEVFDPALRERVLHRIHLESELHGALDGDELALHWQPIVRAVDQSPVGVEALLRWRHPQRGLLTAAQFLPVAGEVGLVPALCQWAVDEALRTASSWRAVPDGPLCFVNLAAAQLNRPMLVEELAAMAATYGLDPSRVQLEVAEDVLGADVQRLTDQLRRLREHGFRIALDDFGAGNTALTWLRRLPIDTLKLDRDFAATLGERPTRTVVRSIVRLAADLGIQTVAEGVESAEQLDFYVSVGCDYTQGYLHGRPGPRAEVVDATWR